MEDLRKTIDKVSQAVCDYLCKYPEMGMEQEELDAICEDCPLNRLHGEANDGH